MAGRNHLENIYIYKCKCIYFLAESQYPACYKFVIFDSLLKYSYIPLYGITLYAHPVPVHRGRLHGVRLGPRPTYPQAGGMGILPVAACLVRGARHRERPALKARLLWMFRVRHFLFRSCSRAPQAQSPWGGTARRCYSRPPLFAPGNFPWACSPAV